MLLSRSSLAVMAVLAVSLPVLPAAAQTAPPAHPHAGAHRGALHGTTSVHPTPKRQHMLEQQRAHHARRGGDAQNHDADRLNEQSLQRAQQGSDAVPAGSDAAGPASAH